MVLMNEYTPEALQRMVEVYLKLGMDGEAKSTAAVLGYNYPGSPWYEDAYTELAKSGVAPPTATAKAQSKPGLLTRTFGSLF